MFRIPASTFAPLNSLHGGVRKLDEVAASHLRALNGNRPPVNLQNMQARPSISNLRMANDRANMLRRAALPRQPPVFEAWPGVMPAEYDEGAALQRAIETSRREARAQAGHSRHRRPAGEAQFPAAREAAEIIFATELSQASPAVAHAMRRAVKKGIARPEDARRLRLVLEKNMPSIAAFMSVYRGHRRYFRQEALAETASPRARRYGWQDQGFIMDHLFSDMAAGNRRLRPWLQAQGLKIVPTSGRSNNCGLDALLKLASGRHGGDFAELASGIKRELVAKFPNEVPHEASMLDFSSDSPAFRYAVAVVNSLFNTNMEVFVVHAGHNGLPVFNEGLPDRHALSRRIVAGSTPVILYNSGFHFEPIVSA